MTVSELKRILQDLEDKEYGDYNLYCSLSGTEEKLTVEKIDLINRRVELS